MKTVDVELLDAREERYGLPSGRTIVLIQYPQGRTKEKQEEKERGIKNAGLALCELVFAETKDWTNDQLSESQGTHRCLRCTYSLCKDLQAKVYLLWGTKAAAQHRTAQHKAVRSMVELIRWHWHKTNKQ